MEDKEKFFEITVDARVEGDILREMPRRASCKGHPTGHLFGRLVEWFMTPPLHGGKVPTFAGSNPAPSGKV